MRMRSGEIFVCCSKISGHQSGFLYVQELKPSNSCTAITWCNWMFYRDLVRYLCFVTRYQVICWDNGTSIHIGIWYLNVTCFMYCISIHNWYTYIFIFNSELCCLLFWVYYSGILMYTFCIKINRINMNDLSSLQ